MSHLSHDALLPCPFQLRLRHGTTELVSELLPDIFTVGQDPANEVMIQDRFISGRHLTDRKEPGGPPRR